jgi:hypothetical protein
VTEPAQSLRAAPALRRLVAGAVLSSRRDRRQARGYLIALLSTISIAIAGSQAHAHDGPLQIRSTGKGSGALAITGAPTGSLALTESACAAGSCLYTNSELAFTTPDTDLGEPVLGALAIATVVRLEVVSADAGASVKLGTTVLDAPGESAQLGVSWSMHAHLILQVTAPQGQQADWTVVVRLTTNSGKYTASSPVTLIVTTASATTTTTTTETSTTTLSTPVCGDGIVDEDEECDAGDQTWANGKACRDGCTLLACGDTDGDGNTSTSDALFTLRAATGARHCDACVCNIDGSAGASPVSATDALRILRIAIGVSSVVPNCPPCS